MDDAIVLVAAVERLKRAWSDSGGVNVAIATSPKMATVSPSLPWAANR
jgi:hypothetical protein